VPPPHNMGKGTGGEGKRNCFSSAEPEARTAPRSSGGNAVHTNDSIPTRPDALIAHPDPSASICVICGSAFRHPESSETFATPGEIPIPRARCPTTGLPRRARRLPPRRGRPPRRDAFRHPDLIHTFATPGMTPIPAGGSPSRKWLHFPTGSRDLRPATHDPRPQPARPHVRPPPHPPHFAFPRRRLSL